MAPLMPVQPYSISTEKKDELKKFFIICEGEHTEHLYFCGIANERSRLGISSNVKIIPFVKTGNDKGVSNPKGLLSLADKKIKEFRKESKEVYNQEVDKFIIVFDADVFKSEEAYLELINEAKSNYILGITNSCFEVWLLLHRKNAYQEIVLPNKEGILKNDRVSNTHTFTSKLFSDEYDMNSKSNLDFDRLVNYIDTAIEEEKYLNQDKSKCFGMVSSNIGTIIEELRKK